MTTEPLTVEERAYLLTLAREIIAEATGRKTTAGPHQPAPPRLNTPGAAFVTLHTRAGELRGCIGSLVAHRPLIEDVR